MSTSTHDPVIGILPVSFVLWHCMELVGLLVNIGYSFGDFWSALMMISMMFLRCFIPRLHPAIIIIILLVLVIS